MTTNPRSSTITVDAFVDSIQGLQPYQRRFLKASLSGRTLYHGPRYGKTDAVRKLEGALKGLSPDVIIIDEVAPRDSKLDKSVPTVLSS